MTTSTKTVREFSAAGPCIVVGTFAGRTKNTVKYMNDDGKVRSRGGWKVKGDRPYVHTEPCRSCRDHPETQYPHGYMD